MSSEATSRRSLLGLAGVASLCCLAPSTAAVSGGVAAGGLAAGLGQVAVTVLTLGVIGLLVSWRSDCSSCEA